MAGKFDHLMPVQVGDIVKEIRAIKKTLIRVGSTAQNAAAMARRAVPIGRSVNQAWNGTAAQGAWSTKTTQIIQVPDGAENVEITGWGASGTSFTAGGILGIYVLITFHGNQDWTFQLAPPISSGVTGAVPHSVSTYGAVRQTQMSAFGITSIEYSAQIYISGASSAGSDNVHMTGSALFYRV